MMPFTEQDLDVVVHELIKKGIFQLENDIVAYNPFFMIMFGVTFQNS